MAPLTLQLANSLAVAGSDHALSKYLDICCSVTRTRNSYPTLSILSVTRLFIIVCCFCKIYYNNIKLEINILIQNSLRKETLPVLRESGSMLMVSQHLFPFTYFADSKIEQNSLQKSTSILFR